MNYSHLQRAANRKKAMTRAAHFLAETKFATNRQKQRMQDLLTEIVDLMEGFAKVNPAYEKRLNDQIASVKDLNFRLFIGGFSY